MVISCIDTENSKKKKKKYINENELKFWPWMTSLNLLHYRTFLVLSNMRVSVLIKAVIISDGFSMAPPVAIAVGIFQGVRPR